MKAKLVPIKSIKTNPKNPRVIKDEKFQKLVKSIQEFPKMLDLRPIVVNKSMMVLGGNQRLKGLYRSWIEGSSNPNCR
jgi:ParB-like chromosome segregation protein Spo0J